MITRRLVAVALVVAGWTASSGLARADQPEELLAGQVVEARSRFARGGTSIITESTLELADGRRVPLRQLGGTVEGIGMVVSHQPPVLMTGDHILARVAVARDLRGREVRIIKEVYAAGGGPTAPFVRTVASRTGVALAWESGCALIRFHPRGTSHLAGGLEFEVMQDTVARWRQAVASCSYLRLVAEGFEEREVGLDAVNMVVFREGRWCRPATDDDPEECYSPDAAGLTTLFFIDDPNSPRNGAILDADVELNAVHFAISVNGRSERPSGCQSDLANTFTHELGHLMGLDHTCFAGGERLLDHEGNPQPNCEPVENLPAAIREATMFNFQECGETKKASVEADDIAGICAMYPIAADPDECRAPTIGREGCCTVAAARGRDPRGGLAVLALAGALLGFARARRRAG